MVFKLLQKASGGGDGLMRHENTNLASYPMVDRHRLTTTRGGKLCLVSVPAQPGDRLYCVEGWDASLVVLRPSGRNSEFVGLGRMPSVENSPRVVKARRGEFQKIITFI
jgi:hypothetical protein